MACIAAAVWLRLSRAADWSKCRCAHRRAVWGQHAAGAQQWLAAHPTHRAATLSLTAMAESVLGKPLNKALQTSDWGARPLSPQQLLYASLDALVCLLIHDAILAQQPDLQLEHFAVSWPA